MAVTMRNPGMITPSHIPMMNLQANIAPKEWQAAWVHSAIAQIKTLML
jgi:hypothetical protein